MSEASEERDARNWLVSAQAGLIGIASSEEFPDPDEKQGVAMWIALAQAEATVAVAQKLEEIREELKTLNREGV